MVSNKDIFALIAFAVKNNKHAVKRAMGINKIMPIRNLALVRRVYNIFEYQGLNALKNIMNQVPLKYKPANDREIELIRKKFL
jgi:hypothetical protein